MIGAQADGLDLFCRHRYLGKVLDVPAEDGDARARSLLEMYANNIAFAAEHGFSEEAASTFFSIMKKTFDQSMGAYLACCASAERRRCCDMI